MPRSASPATPAASCARPVAQSTTNRHIPAVNPRKTNMGAAVYPDARRAADCCHEGARRPPGRHRAWARRPRRARAGCRRSRRPRSPPPGRPAPASRSPKPTATGTSAAARTRSTTSPSSGGSAARSPVTPGHRHHVDEPSRGLRDPRARRPAAWSARRAGPARTRPRRRPRAARPPRRPACRARSGRRPRGRPAGRRRAPSRARAAGSRNTSAPPGTSPDSGAATSSRTRSNVAPALQRPLPRGLDRGAVGERIGERHAELDEVGVRLRRPPDLERLREGREAAHQVRHQRRAAAVANALQARAAIRVLSHRAKGPRRGPCRRAR